MKICTECGAQLSDDNRFCTTCGASLADAQVVPGEPETKSETVEEKTEETAAEAEEAVEAAEATPASETVSSEPPSLEDIREEVEAKAAAASETAAEETTSEAEAAATAAAVAVVPPVSQGYSYEAPTSNPNAGSSEGVYTPPAGDKRGITERNIGLCILFSIITCGIYLYYWVYKVNEEINQLSDTKNGTSGGMVILFDIITCGFYAWYWMFRMGERVDVMKGDRNGSHNVMYLLLSIFGLGIVSIALMQDEINKAIRA